MKFTVERAALVKMLELVGKKMPGQKRRDKTVRLSACAARVFVEGNQTTAGVEALVLQDGACVLAHDLFLKLLKSYAPKVSLTFEANEKSIRFATTALPISGYAATAVPPGHFQTMAVTDLGVLIPSKIPVEPPKPAAPVNSPGHRRG